jgi:hypothetical protein
MTAKKQRSEGGLSQDELNEQSADQLPNREAATLLDLDLDLSLDADIAAPIDAAIAANANVAVPVNASVAANIIGIGSTAISSADQDSIIVQELNGVANAEATQDATMNQGEDMSSTEAPATSASAGTTGSQ